MTEATKNGKKKGVRLGRLNLILTGAALLTAAALLLVTCRIGQCCDPAATDALQRLLWLQRILTVLLLLIVVGMALAVSRLLIRPLKRCAGKIRRQESLPLSGAQEIRALAESYNGSIEQGRQTREQLSYEATHDALTGLYNRSAFESLRESLTGEPHALLLVDIDDFKHINDTMGHDVGDRVLRRVASVLKGSFRSEDHVCRHGGDELSVLMRHAGPELESLIREKLSGIRAKLSQPQGSEPAVTLSVGVAFADEDCSAEQLYKRADLALYRVKNGGRDGCAFD